MLVILLHISFLPVVRRSIWLHVITYSTFHKGSTYTLPTHACTEWTVNSILYFSSCHLYEFGFCEKQTCSRSSYKWIFLILYIVVQNVVYVCEDVDLLLYIHVIRVNIVKRVFLNNNSLLVYPSWIEMFPV